MVAENPRMRPDIETRLFYNPAEVFIFALGDYFPVFAKGFEYGLDMGRVTYWEAAEKSWSKMGGDWSVKLGDHIGNVFGTPSLERVGMTPKQQAIERSFVFFAPRFRLYKRSLYNGFDNFFCHFIPWLVRCLIWVHCSRSLVASVPVLMNNITSSQFHVQFIVFTGFLYSLSS